MSTTPDQTAVPPLRLPGQAAAPDGPVDLTMMYLMHHGFRRDLAAFAARGPAHPAGRRRHLAGPAAPLGDLLRGAAPPPPGARTPGCGRTCSSARTPPSRRRCAPWRPSTRRSTRCSTPAAPACARSPRAWRPRRPRRPRRAPGRRPREPGPPPRARGARRAAPSCSGTLTARSGPRHRGALRRGLGPRMLLALVPWALHEVPADVPPRVLARGRPPLARRLAPDPPPLRPRRPGGVRPRPGLRDRLGLERRRCRAGPASHRPNSGISHSSRQRGRAASACRPAIARLTGRRGGHRRGRRPPARDARLDPAPQLRPGERGQQRVDAGGQLRGPPGRARPRRRGTTGAGAHRVAAPSSGAPCSACHARARSCSPPRHR